MLIQIIIATLIISLISLIGLSIFFQKKYTPKIMEATISLAAAVLLGSVFFHLLPEVVEMQHEQGVDFHTISLWILGTIIFFFLTEKFLHWHHCQQHDHHKDCVHPMGYNIIIGDALHNFTDGIIIAISFMLDLRIGIMATAAIALHEIPQEIGDFSLLLRAGFTKARALFWNFISALSALLGGVITYFYTQTAEHQLFFTALATGSFLYIAMADIMPHLHGEKNKHHLQQLIWFILGLLIIYYFNQLFHFDAHHH
jgi:zinc and cadmium transporter